jgi:hypothetical protein
LSIVARQDPLGSERPGEACQCLVRGDAAGAEATSHKERRYLGAQSDPAIGEADDEQACVAGCFEHTCFARADEHGLCGDSNNLLHEKRGADKKPAGVATLQRGIRLGSEEPERCPERLSEPGGHLDGGPIVLDASERRHDRPGGHVSRS